MNSQYYCVPIIFIFLTVLGCNRGKDRSDILEKNIQSLQERVVELEKEMASLKKSPYILKDDMIEERQETSQISVPKKPEKSFYGISQNGWTKIKEWKGYGAKTTETFAVGSNWAISWSTTVNPQVGFGYFSIMVCASNGDMIDFVGNISTSGSDISYLHNTGTYYLKINTAQSYSVAVLEYDGQ